MNKSIFHETVAGVTVEIMNQNSKGTIAEKIGIEFTEVGEDYLVAKMPVDERTFQPARILHGGASVVLAETLGSSSAALTLDFSKQYCVGLEINANHIRAMREGWVYGKSKALHIGRSTQVWEITITDESDRLVCISRITMAILNH